MPKKDETVEVQATVNTKQETERGIRFELDVPAFKSKYPTIVTVPEDEDIAGALKPGQTYNLVLIRENPKEGKAEDSTRMYDFYWGVADAGGSGGAAPAAAPTTPAPSQPPAQGRPAPPAASQGRTDATGISIERQKALDLAGRDFDKYLEAHAHDVDKVPKTFREYAAMVTQVAAAYAKFLASGEPMKPPEAKQTDTEKLWNDMPGGGQ